MERQAKVDAVNAMFGNFFKLIWLIIFLAVSFGVYKEAHLGHDFWVTDIFRGLFGGVLLTYPIYGVFIGFDEMAHNYGPYLAYTILLAAFSHSICGMMGL